MQRDLAWSPIRRCAQCHGRAAVGIFLVTESTGFTLALELCGTCSLHECPVRLNRQVTPLVMFDVKPLPPEAPHVTAIEAGAVASIQTQAKKSHGTRFFYSS